MGVLDITILRAILVGHTRPTLRRSSSPYFTAEQISKRVLLYRRKPRNIAASQSVHSLPPFRPMIALGILKHCESRCLGKADRATRARPAGLRPKFFTCGRWVVLSDCECVTDSLFL